MGLKKVKIISFNTDTQLYSELNKRKKLRENEKKKAEKEEKKQEDGKTRDESLDPT